MSDSPINPRAAALIRELDLKPHPEGGYFREVFRSESAVHPSDGRTARSALTSIHFLLGSGQYSRWHRVASDEAWHFYEGKPLELFWVDPDNGLHRELLSEATRTSVVPAHCWQAARPSGSYTFVGCTVGPGFDFDDFEMITTPSSAWSRLQRVNGLPEGLV